MISTSAYAKRKTRRDLREFAAYMRTLCGVRQNFLDVEEMIDLALPRQDPEFHYIIEEVEDMPDFLGLANPAERSFRIRRDVYDGMRAGKPDDRVTVLHEVSHVLLHTPEHTVFPKTATRPPQTMCPEWQADTLAAELAAPPQFAKVCASPLDLARRAGIPVWTGLSQWAHFEREGLI